MRVFVALSIVTLVLAIGSGVLLDVGWRYEKDRAVVAGHVSLALALVALVGTWVHIGMTLSRWV